MNMIDLQNESWMDDAKENRSGQIPVFYQQLTVRKHAGLIGSQGTAGNVTAAGQQRASVVHVRRPSMSSQVLVFRALQDLHRM